MAMSAMNDLTNLSRNQLAAHGCVNDQFTNLTDAIAQVDQNSPLFEQQESQVLIDIHALMQ